MSISASLQNTYYNFSEVENIFQGRERVKCTDLCTKEQNLVCNVILSDPDIKLPVYDVPSPRTCQMLYALGEDSKVGKGSKTVLDKKVRSSKEHTGSNVQWDEKFIEGVKAEVQKSLTAMNSGRLISLTPYKLVIYGPNDFFSEHLDSTHTKGQNMTCVVELNTDWEGKGLEINGKKYHPGNKEIVQCIVFDHDLPHQVHLVEYGFRLSVTFDLVVDPTVESKGSVLSPVVEKMKQLGVKRFGFFSTHYYMGDQAYKGVDAQLVQEFGKLTTKTERLNLMTDDCVSWFHEDIWAAKNSGPECGSLMHEIDHYSDDEDYPDEETYHGEYYSPPSVWYKTDVPSSWSPKKEKHVFKDKYCLGDVFLLWSPHKPRHNATGDEEVHLGNEGFGGDIHENVFILFTI